MSSIVPPKNKKRHKHYAGSLTLVSYGDRSSFKAAQLVLVNLEREIDILDSLCFLASSNTQTAQNAGKIGPVQFGGDETTWLANQTTHGAALPPDHALADHNARTC